MSGARPERLIPARPGPTFTRFFIRYVRRLTRRRFHAVRLVEGGDRLLREAGESDRPLMVLLNHASWWDPLIGVLVGSTITPLRPALAPIDREQLERFGFFRRIGLFGIDPDDPESLVAMRDYVLEAFARDPRTSLWLTPQGRFTDVRSPIRIRPGAASIAAAAGELDVLSLAVEYVFWQDSRPEVLLRLERVRLEGAASTTAWHRAMTGTMQANADALAELARERDPEAFILFHGGPARNNMLYDLLLRLRGRSGEIAARRETDRSAANA